MVNVKISYTVYWNYTVKQMVLDGEAQCARQIVTLPNYEGKIVASDELHYPVVSCI